MRRRAGVLLALCLSYVVPLFGRPLPDAYLIRYGDPEAPVQVTEYFSFSCPHCIQLFLEDFAAIKTDHLDSTSTAWNFHPVPADLLTVQAMACLDQLSNAEKQIFLEELLAEAREETPIRVVVLMEKMMEVFGKPIPNLRDMDALEKSDAFLAAFHFVKDGVDIEGVPVLALNGEILEGSLPTRRFVSRLLSEQTNGEET